MSSGKHEEVVSTDTVPGASYNRNQSLVFISHDSRDAELAEAFSRLLTSVSAGVLKSFRSSDKRGNQGIEYGVEWYQAIMAKLEDASDVVCLLTKRSANRPWILYEAGVAKGKLGSTVFGLALGLPLSSASAGPFAQFQNSSDDVDSITKLVLQLLERVPNADPDDQAVQLQVTAFKQKSDEILERLNEEDTNTEEVQQVGSESVAKLFEEVKVMFDELPSRIDSKIASVVPSPSRSKPRRLHTRMISDITHSLGYGSPQSLPTIWLIVITQLREELPWLYEAGLQVYEALRSGRTTLLPVPSRSRIVQRAIKEFRATLQFTFEPPGARLLLDNGLISSETLRYGLDYMFLLNEMLNTFSALMSVNDVQVKDTQELQEPKK